MGSEAFGRVRQVFAALTWEQWLRFAAVVSLPLLGIILAVVR